MKHKISRVLVSALLCVAMLASFIPAIALPAAADEGDKYELVTDVSTLAVDDQVIIVAKDDDYALSTTQNANNRGQAGVTKSNDTISKPGADVQLLTLKAGTTAGTTAGKTWAFLTNSNGYLYAASSSKNYLKTELTLSANSSWKIEIGTDGTATITAQGTNTRNVMQYNKSSKIFACYNSASQQAICLYKLVESTDETPTPDQPTCEHTNTEAIGEAKAATCIEAGITAGEKCSDCGVVLTAQQTIPAVGHTYVDGVCSCGAKDTPLIAEGEYIIYYSKDGTNNAMKAAVESGRLGYTTITVTNNAVTDDSITADIRWIIDYVGNGVYTIYNSASSRYAASTGAANKAQLLSDATDTKAQWTATVNTDGTVDFVNVANDANNVNKTLRNNGTFGFACYGTGTGGALTLYKLPECTHENTTVVNTSACMTDGIVGKEICVDCTEVINPGTVVPTIGSHNFVDGKCTNDYCNVEQYKYQLVTSVDELKIGTQVIIVANGALYAMGEPVDYVHQSVGIEIDEETNTIVFASDSGIRVITLSDIAADVTTTGTSFSMSVEGDKYLFSYGEDILREGTLNANATWTFTMADGLATIMSNGSTKTYVGYNNNVFATKTTEQSVRIYKIVCAHTTTVPSESVAPTCTAPGKTAGTVCADCGAVVTEGTEIAATGHTEVSIDEVPATCTSTGKTAGVVCSVCKEVISGCTETPKADHNYENGSCTVCEQVEYEVVTTVSHGDVILLAYCAKDGVYHVLSDMDEKKGLTTKFEDGIIKDTGLLRVTVIEISAGVYALKLRDDTGRYLYAENSNDLFAGTGVTDTNAQWTVKDGHFWNVGQSERVIQCNFNNYNLACYKNTQGNLNILNVGTCDHEHDAGSITCKYCDKVCDHNFVENKCDNCSLEIKFSQVSVSVNNSFALNFYVDPALLAMADSYTVTLTMDGKAFTYTQEDSLTRFTYPEINPSNMGLKVTADLVITIGDNEYTATATDSVKDYCLRLRETADEKLTAVINDMLIYGASVEKYVGKDVTIDKVYDADGEVTKTITSNTVVNVDTTFSKSDDIVSADGITWTGAEAVLGDTVNIRVYFTVDADTTIDKTLFAITNAGNAGLDVSIDENGNGYVETTALALASMGSKITVSYNGASVNYSVGVYANNVKDDDADFASVADAILKLATSLKAYNT